MPVLIERVQSQGGTVALDSSKAKEELLYALTGTEDESIAKTAIEAVFPLTWATCLFQSYDLKHLGGGVWDVQVHYGGVPPRQQGDNDYNFEIGGGTTHITQSLETISKTAAAGNAPDNQGSIGVTADGAVEGCDIETVAYEWSETWYFDPSNVTTIYINALADICKHTNDDTFRGYPAGEVLFRGASGKPKDKDNFAITFKFARSKNKTNFDVGPITVPSKKGWQYLWVLYRDKVDEHRLIKQPVAAYVERVYDEADFSSIGIGS
jgi:hypothetical protein